MLPGPYSMMGRWVPFEGLSLSSNPIMENSDKHFRRPSFEVSRRMAKVRQKGTGIELALRKELHRRGLRYRVNLEVIKKPRRVAD